MMASAAWTPLDLGAKLKVWWAPPGGANTTLAGGAISGWADEVGGHVLAQSTAASRPAYSATGFSGGLPCATFDGVNDSLVLDGIPSSVPTAKSPSEVWVHGRCDTPVDDASSDNLFDYGGSGSGSDRRTLGRISADRAILGYNGLSSMGTVGSVAPSGTHVWRGVYQSAFGRLDIDGVAGPEVSTTANNTGTARIRMGGRCDSTTAAPWTGAIRQVLITEPLTDDEAALLYEFLNGES